MKDELTRRDFLAAGAASAAAALVTPSSLFASQPREDRGSSRGEARNADIAVGITVDTRPDWNGAANFIRSLDESSALGYRMIETFRNYVAPWINDNNPEGLQEEFARRNLGLVTISGGGNFTDPAQRADTIEYNLEISRFMQHFGCTHLKINIGGEQPRGQARQSPEVYQAMATGFNQLGEQLTDMGIKFGIHAHLNSAFETYEDIEAIMDMTDPRHVWFILDTGHITMAGMDPVQLTRDYIERITEFHMKDCHPDDLGGTSRTMGRMVRPSIAGPQGVSLQDEYGLSMGDLPASVRYRDRHFYELGRGGVDFRAIKQICDEANWTGWMTVELDSTITTSQGSATVSKEYMERVLGLDVERIGQRPSWET